RGATAVVDGGWGWGMVAMMLATETAIELAAEHGVAAVAVRRSNHIGRVAPYVIKIAEAGMVGVAVTNANPAVVPYGGKGRVFGTNPIAWAAPRGEGRRPVVHDIATAAVAEGKLRVARAKGEAVVPGLIIDGDGRPTVDPEDFYGGGALLPFGGHKGSGLSVLVQLLGRGLAGADPENLAAHRGGNGPVVLALDVGFFGPPAAFAAEADALCVEIQSTQPAPEFDEVLLPGEPEARMRERLLAEGVPIAERTWEDLLALATEKQVAVP
ncbi:MAG: Ldh family oxidoreductase, partial [Chloroflexota bacterium]|nr:Ldh family oxidoreductase [Chloroflexota bacterium]